MSRIITNPKVALTMDELELRARKGDPWAQQEIFKRSMQFASVVMDEVKQGADMVNRNEQLIVGGKP